MHLRHSYIFIYRYVYSYTPQWQLLSIKFLIFKRNTNISKELSNDHTCYNLTISLGVWYYLLSAYIELERSKMVLWLTAEPFNRSICPSRECYLVLWLTAEPNRFKYGCLLSSVYQECAIRPFCTDIFIWRFLHVFSNWKKSRNMDMEKSYKGKILLR